MGSLTLLGGFSVLVCLGVAASCATGVDEAADSDGDGYANTVDCDDNNAAVNPDGYEICDGIDNDCDGIIDESDAEGTFTWYADKDNDGHGVSDDTVKACDQPEGYASQKGDCNDEDPDIHPGAKEICSEDVDYNCDGSTGFDDQDMDGVPACDDCDDTDAEIKPGAMEICNGKDDNCDGKIDTDELSHEQLCGTVPNGTAECKGAEGCAIVSCDSTWYDANGTGDDGCECQASPLPEGDAGSCATAIDLGTLTDAAKDKTVISGNGVPAARDVWYSFTAIDDLDTAGDEFHVDVRFTKNPGMAYQMDVYRNGCPLMGEELAKGELDVFDWFTDQAFTTMGCTVGMICGEGNCGTVADASGKCQCDDDTATFFVRIHRPDGMPSCDEYELEVTNGVYDAP